MTDREIIRHIDDGANFYIRLFGDAVHMENTDGEFYSCVRPKAGEHGISFIYNVRIEQLAPKQKKAVYDAFSDGASIVTVRAVNAAARKLYEAVGFTVYG